jgi:hypothetical protein
MAKRPGTDPKLEADEETRQSRPSDLAPAIGALSDATKSLVLATNQLLQFAHDMASAAAGRDAGLAGLGISATQINTLEDDPFSEAVPSTNPTVASPIAVTVPLNPNPRLQINIVEPRPAPARYTIGSPEFRYWLATDALTRGIDFWVSLLPLGTTWSTSNPMRVALVAGEQLNASYSRISGLRFFQGMILGKAIFSCESPDVACHELGHAILDALRPQLFNAASTEAGAFHESFGDITAILTALQLPSVRTKVIAETQGHLNVNSRLSRVAEQLGWGIRQLSPTAVDRDSLRNAANRFIYVRPDLLPFTAPASRLSSAVHSFSRIFTGAFLDAFARMFKAAGLPNESNLLAASRDIGQLLVDAIVSAPIRPAYYSQLALAMVQADQVRNNGRYRAALTSAFVERGILSVNAMLTLDNAPGLQAIAVQADAVLASDAGAGSSTIYAYEGTDMGDGYRLGYGETPELPVRRMSLGDGLTCSVHAADENAQFEVAPAAVSNAPQEVLTPEAAAQFFVEDLFQERRIDVGAAKSLMPAFAEGDPDRRTHVLIADDNGTVVLRRNHFHCGFGHCSSG